PARRAGAEDAWQPGFAGGAIAGQHPLRPAAGICGGATRQQPGAARGGRAAAAVATFLGTGTSTGVPTLGCRCRVCTSSDPRDQRLRPSLWLRFSGGHNVVIDTTPDFRTQALRAGIPALDAVLYTHSHADHIMGLDDIRPFNFGRPDPLPVYANAGTLADLRRVFQYVFENNYPASAIPRIAVHAL